MGAPSYLMALAKGAPLNGNNPMKPRTDIPQIRLQPSFLNGIVLHHWGAFGCTFNILDYVQIQHICRLKVAQGLKLKVFNVGQKK